MTDIVQKNEFAALAAALTHQSASRLTAAEDAKNAVMALSQHESRRTEVQVEVTALTRARDLSERSFKAGATTLSDLLIVDRQVLARDELHNAQASAARSAVAVFRALSGGWTSINL